MKVRLFSLRAAIAGACMASLVAAAQTLALPPNLISLASEAGGQLLIESSARQAYWPLSIQFVTQKNQAYCGVASMVMVLNALGVDAPATPDIEPFKTFTQDNALNPDTERILPAAELLENGMTLDQFGQLLGVHGAKVQVYHADESSVDRFRTVAAEALGARDRYVVVNYLRRTLGQERGGHISPLAAYDAKTDRFLVLDVSRYKYPPVWVKTTELYAAMDTADSDNQNRHRGFVLVRMDQ